MSFKNFSEYTLPADYFVRNFLEKIFWINQLIVYSLVETHINFLIPARNNSYVVSWLGDWYWQPVSLILFGLSCQFEDPSFLRGDMRRGWSLITYPRAGIFQVLYTGSTLGVLMNLYYQLLWSLRRKILPWEEENK